MQMIVLTFKAKVHCTPKMFLFIHNEFHSFSSVLTLKWQLSDICAIRSLHLLAATRYVQIEKGLVM